MTLSERGKTIIATGIATAAIYYGVETMINTQRNKLYLGGAYSRLQKMEQRLDMLERERDSSPTQNIPNGARLLHTTNGQTIWFVPCATTRADKPAPAADSKLRSTTKPNVP